MLQRRELTGLAKTFWDTAQYLREHEWCQGVLEDGNAVCIMGACYRVTGGGLARGFIDEFDRHAGVCAPDWNDHPGRTKQECIDKLEEIAWKLADDQ